MKLGLITTPAPGEVPYHVSQPLGLGYLMSYLARELPQIDIVYSLSSDAILSEKIDVLGISACTEVFGTTIQYAKQVKECLGIPVILGGPHITNLPESLPDVFDVGVIGEGEETLEELMIAYSKHGSFNNDDLANVDGICYHDRIVTITKARDVIQDINTIPLPDRKKLWIGHRTNRAYVFTTRGCPYKCVFCASTKLWPKLRSFSPRYVVDELKSILGMGINDVHFFDDLFIVPRDRLAAIATLMKQEGLTKQMRFSGAVRANLVDDRLAETLNSMNVVEVMFGAESFSPKVLSYLKRGTVTPEDNQKAIDVLHKHGILVNVAIIYASPMETKEDMQLTFDALERNLSSGKLNKWSRGLLRPYPGTEVWDYALERGLVSNDTDWTKISSFGGVYLNEHMREEELYQLLALHERRCLEMAPDNIALRHEWGLTEEADLIRSVYSTRDPKSREIECTKAANYYTSKGRNSEASFWYRQSGRC